jgi:hypothetical protein
MAAIGGKEPRPKKDLQRLLAHSDGALPGRLPALAIFGDLRMGDVAVIFGTQRCGSNYFLSACRRLGELLVLGEMYHRGGAFPFQGAPQPDFEIKQRLGHILQKMFEEQAAACFEGFRADAEFDPSANAVINEALVKFSHKFPQKYFAGLRELAGARRLLFKIFPEHLDLFQILGMLRQQRPHVILMLRNPLDSFISYKKLVETKKPQDVDTSELKITFNKAEYFAYKAGLATYFTAIREFCEDEWIDVSTVHYEWLHGGEAERKPEKVRETLQRVFGVPMNVSPAATALPLFRQQDKSGSPAEKVLNPNQLPVQPQVLL